MLVSAIRNIPVVDFRTCFQKFLRLFRHSDRQRFFRFDILLFRIFADVLRDFHQAESNYLRLDEGGKSEFSMFKLSIKAE